MEIQAAPDLHEARLNRTADRVERLWFQGVRVEVLVTSGDTGGEWSLVANTTPPGFRGLPAHLHRSTTEAFRLVSGRLRFRIDGHERVLASDEMVVVPPGLVHSYSNPYDESARVLIHSSPGGTEGYLRDLAAYVARAPTWPPIDLCALDLPAEQYDIFRQ